MVRGRLFRPDKVRISQGMYQSRMDELGYFQPDVLFLRFGELLRRIGPVCFVICREWRGGCQKASIIQAGTAMVEDFTGLSVHHGDHVECINKIVMTAQNQIVAVKRKAGYRLI